MKKIKGLYIFLGELDLKSDGISKKILNQYKALNKSGYTCDLLQIKKEEILLNGLKRGDCKKRIWIHLNVFKNILKNINIQEYDYIYIRYPGSSPFFIKFLEKIKKYSNKIKILIEIPTYPYEGERKSIKGFLFRLIDCNYRRFLKKNVDYIVTFSEDKEIFDIKTLKISNGVNLDEIKIKSNCKNSSKIIFTSVSHCRPWHGIDRFLLSLDKYGNLLEKKEIEFNIVGVGQETQKLKKIVENSEYLKNIVIFNGFKTENELDKIYDKTTIALGSLGRHRSNINIIKTLKNREYAAKGLPMIFSEIDLDFENVNFVYKISANEDLIDIKKIIEWYNNLEVTSEEIRKYSEKFSWKIQMGIVIKKIEENRDE